jgi:hypothetical protein
MHPLPEPSALFVFLFYLHVIHARVHVSVKRIKPLVRIAPADTLKIEYSCSLEVFSCDHHGKRHSTQRDQPASQNKRQHTKIADWLGCNTCLQQTAIEEMRYQGQTYSNGKRP